MLDHWQKHETIKDDKEYHRNEVDEQDIDAPNSVFIVLETDSPVGTEQNSRGGRTRRSRLTFGKSRMLH